MGSPTWWRGRLYVGSCDGWVYCLEATTGSLAWRYRVAPEERRIVIGGQLSSAWPIVANVLVEDGTLYAAGGLVGQLGGAVLCALDAGSGQPRWEQRFGQGVTQAGPALDDDSPSQTSPLCPSAAGQLAWYGGRLWWHAGEAGVLVVDPASGATCEAIDFDHLNRQTSPRKKYPPAATWQHTRGQDIGVLPGGWVALGGRQFNLPLTSLGQPGNVAVFLQAKPNGALQDAGGYPYLLELPAAHVVDTIPVWDSTGVLLSGKPAGWQTSPLGPILCRSLGEVLAAYVSRQPFDAEAVAREHWQAGLYRAARLELPAEQQHLAIPDDFNLKSRNFLTPVLAANAVVFVSGRTGDFHVVAVNRTDRCLLWDVKLPAQPVFGGLSLTRAGDVLVPLADGRIVCIGTEKASP
jgi:outer membrane protein assembly factor BamB